MEEECKAGESEERGVLKQRLQAAKNLDSLSWKMGGAGGDTDLNPVHFHWFLVFFIAFAIKTQFVAEG